MTLAPTSAVIILSGGLDSTVSLAMAIEEQGWQIPLALTFDYGQRPREQELKAATAIAKYYGISHQIISFPWLTKVLPVDLRQDIKLQSEAKAIEEAALKGVNRVWVPNRNGLFLNVAACFAEAYNTGKILFGANVEEAEAGFPDNTLTFRNKINEALYFSTQNHVEVCTPVGSLTKRQIVAKGTTLKAPLHLIWSCYNAEEKHCRRCPSCLLLFKALSENNCALAL